MENGVIPQAWKHPRFRRVLEGLIATYPDVVSGKLQILSEHPQLKPPQPSNSIVKKRDKKTASTSKIQRLPLGHQNIFQVPGTYSGSLETSSLVWARPYNIRGIWWPGVTVPPDYRHLVSEFKNVQLSEGETIVVYLEAPSQYISYLANMI